MIACNDKCRYFIEPIYNNLSYHFYCSIYNVRILSFTTGYFYVDFNKYDSNQYSCKNIKICNIK